MLTINNICGLSLAVFNRNYNKKVKILVYDGSEVEVFIKAACKYADAFTYIGHKSERPRYKLEAGNEESLPILAQKGYFVFTPDRILF